MLRSAEQQTQGNAEAGKSYQEYAERIHYRLDTRQIIDKPGNTIASSGAAQSKK